MLGLSSLFMSTRVVELGEKGMSLITFIVYDIQLMSSKGGEK